MFLLSTVQNTHGLVSFDHDSAPGYDLFFDGTDLSGITFKLAYKIKRKSDIKRLSGLHFIHSTGPELVSNAFRSIIEQIAPNSVEFFDPIITCGNETVSGFSVINVREKQPCIDLEQSEYRQTNFDVSNPKYMFSYIKLLKIPITGNEIYRCMEQQRYIIVSNRIKDMCIEKHLGGLCFCRAIDLTYADRSDCIES